MKERPILFSAPMVRAILNGSNAQTRQVVKPQPFHDDDYHDGDIQFAMWTPRGTYDPLYAEFSVGAVGGGGGKRDSARFPYGEPGDRLWVRETFALSVIDPNGGSPQDDPENYDVIYRADPDQPGGEWTDGDGNSIPTPWRSSIHMPRWASRILLDVTGVRVERLQDISEADAIAEGIDGCDVVINGRSRGKTWRDYSLKCDDPCEWFSSPIKSYRTIWESINGASSWDANPWVGSSNFGGSSHERTARPTLPDRSTSRRTYRHPAR